MSVVSEMIVKSTKKETLDHQLLQKPSEKKMHVIYKGLAFSITFTYK